MNIPTDIRGLNTILLRQWVSIDFSDVILHLLSVLLEFTSIKRSDTFLFSATLLVQIAAKERQEGSLPELSEHLTEVTSENKPT